MPYKAAVCELFQLRCYIISSPMSLKCNRKQRGLRSVPWGTPDLTINVVLGTPSRTWFTTKALLQATDGLDLDQTTNYKKSYRPGQWSKFTQHLIINSKDSRKNVPFLGNIVLVFNFLFYKNRPFLTERIPFIKSLNCHSVMFQTLSFVEWTLNRKYSWLKTD